MILMKQIIIEFLRKRFVALLFCVATVSMSLAQSIQGQLPIIEMVRVPGGSFEMGLNEDEAEHSYETPRHEVYVSSYSIGKYEVTQSLWEAVMDNNPSIVKGDNLPVNNVSWNEVQLFIKKLNHLTGERYRLPTEAEWEYAAKGGNYSESYTYIGGNDTDTTSWTFNNSGNTIHNVGEKKPNELGIHDMGGNVQEWVMDWFGKYESKQQNNPKGPKSSDIGKILRGGCYNILPQYNKPENRFVSNPNFKASFIGFRLAL